MPTGMLWVTGFLKNEIFSGGNERYAHLSQQQKKEQGDVSNPLNFPEVGASVHSAIKACKSVMWIDSWVWCCGKREQASIMYSTAYYTTIYYCIYCAILITK
ncbi:hypothetical protein XENOCAPTIV_019215 [Xenoophorus captivus]|uniref:Uncharacterized protein n=1 Tax=Xenoophorus captivus TaxID=1517983 RepID=A0ABV0QJ36_9TELE